MKQDETNTIQSNLGYLGAGHLHKALTIQHLRGYRLPLQVFSLSSPPQSHSSNNSPSSRPLVWRLIRALPGNPFGSHYQAYSRRRYPRQYYIVTRMATHHGIIVPSMEYLSSRKPGYSRGHMLWSQLPMGTHYLMLHTRVAEACRLTLVSTFQSDGYPTKLPCSPSDSGRSAASTASI
jgi:hypothetical protein